MAQETDAIRRTARRVKDLALQKAAKILEAGEPVWEGSVTPIGIEPVTDNERVSDVGEFIHKRKMYVDTYLTVLKNAVPRVQVINGDDEGGAVEVNATITGMQIINQAIGNSPKIEQPEAGTSV